NKIQAEIDQNKVILDSKKSLLSEQNELFDDLNQELQKLSNEVKDIDQNLAKFKNTREQVDKIKKEFSEIQERYKQIELNKVSFEKEAEGIQKLINLFEEDINKKLIVKQSIEKNSQLLNWMQDYFVNVVDMMEKQVMLRIYSEFDSLFQNWFNVLLEDEVLSVRLDEEFTPIIQQDGYESNINNLSGGEKTSVALAYRLALNKVINDITAEIKTKDIIILDEPTDGFSTEQLDKFKDILDDINTKQTIIVSHEPKMESFVQNVIRISKNEHVSRVLG
ncbi:hypothetical protein ACFL0W_04845, partial [Nanoarchaeota archaeon]